ncbi:MAG: NnrU family protein [Ghiorsea sp.]|nr:NnrU family protein [Ghiorsea sp.]
MESIILLWLYTLAFAVLHSLMATNSLKTKLYAKGVTTQYYRLFYSVFGIITTLIWLWMIYPLADARLYQVDGFVRYLLYAMQVVGLLIAMAAFMPIDGAVFLGLKKAEQSSDPFIVQGVFKYIRHPMYAGFMLFLLAKPEQSVISFHFALAVSLYFIIGSKFEEKRMLAEHPSYADYQQKVGAFIPKLWNRS